MPKAFNSRALTSEKPCINMEFHAPLMHRYLIFHMHDSGQYSINSEGASCLQLKLSIKVYVRVMQIRILLKKNDRAATLDENVSGNDLNLCNTANGWQKITIDDLGLKRGFFRNG